MSDVPRYWLLAGKTHYPYDGWEDCFAGFWTIEEAKAVAVKGRDSGLFCRPVDWAQILDRETMTVILRGESDGEGGPWEWEEVADE